MIQDDKSRMSRQAHVRSCGSRGLKCPRPPDTVNQRRASCDHARPTMRAAQPKRDWSEILTLFRAVKMDPPVSLQFGARLPVTTKAAERIPAAQRPSFRVEVLRLHSNHVRGGLELHNVRLAAVSARRLGDVGVRRQRQRRLSAHESNEVVAAFRDGLPVKTLAARYQVSRWTITSHLRANGLGPRPRGLNPENVPEAIRLHEEPRLITLLL